METVDIGKIAEELVAEIESVITLQQMRAEGKAEGVRELYERIRKATGALNDNKSRK